MSPKKSFPKYFLFFILIAFTFESKSIFDETTLRHLKLKNRIFRAAVGDNCFKDGKISEKGLELYDQLSKNEVGTIFTGYTAVSDYTQIDGLNSFRIDKDEYIPEFKKLTDLVHNNGANIIMQLVHIGMNTKTNADVIYAPTALPIKDQNRKSKTMSVDDINRIENDFVEAALRAQKAGFDGVEIHAAHFYLVSEFLSPLYNKRGDKYGGNDENRARFLAEIIEKIRAKVGEEFIIGAKINSEDGEEKGITEDGFIIACQMAEKAGADYIQISGISWTKMKANSPIYRPIGEKLSTILNIPVMITAGARNVDDLNDILNGSNIQYFGIGRPLICEYDLIKKWKEGTTKKVKCISCNTCLDPSKHIGVCVFNQNKCNVKYANAAPLQSIKLGHYRVTYIPDGEGLTRNFEQMLAGLVSTKEDKQKLKEYLDVDGKLVISYGAFLIEHKEDKILFDLGIGNETYTYLEGVGHGGELLNNLRNIGVDRRNITKVIISHFHPSHIGWTSIEENGKRVLTFPNADYYSSRYEWEFWENKTEGLISIDPVKFKEPLEGKIKFLEKDEEELIPNLYVKFVFGHTPGLVNLILKTDDKRIWFLSDVVHTDLEFEFPLGFFFVDNNEKRAFETRKSLFDELSKPNTIIANGHFIEDAFGYLKKVKDEEGKYKFERYLK